MTELVLLSPTRAKLEDMDDEKVLAAVDEKLSFPDPGAEYKMRQKRFQVWGYDGKKHLFLKTSQSFPIGFVSTVVKVLKKHKVKHKVVDRRENLPERRPAVPVHFFKPRDYQAGAVEKFVKDERGILRHPTGSGKTCTAAMIIAELGVPHTLFITHRTNLALQTRKTIAKALNVPLKEIGFVGRGKWKPKQVTVALLPSLSARFHMPATIKAVRLGYHKNGKKFPADRAKALRMRAQRKALDAFLKSVHLLILDECFEGRTMVTLASGKRATIQSIVRSRDVLSVKSYNSKTNRLEDKRVVRKIQKLYEKKLVKITARVHGRTRTVLCTPNHKIWRDEISKFIRADELLPGDSLLFAVRQARHVDVCPPPKLVRKGTGKVGRGNPKFRGGIHRVGSKARQYYYVSESVVADLLPHIAELAGVSLFRAKRVVSKLPRMTSARWKRSYVVASVAAGRPVDSSRFDVHHIDDNPLNDRIENLEVVSRGDHSRHSGNQYVGRDVSTQVFKAVGVVLKVEEGATRKWVYNLEVEDNHNFFANDILVSNCHHAAADTWKQLAERCPARWRLGLSGTPLDREDGKSPLVIASTGEVIHRVRSKRLIEDGMVAEPVIRFVPIIKTRRGTTRYLYDDAIDEGADWHTTYSEGVVDNAYRNWKALKIAAQGNTPVLMLVNYVRHGRVLRRSAKKRGLKVTVVHGRMPREKQERILRRYKQGKIGILIATTELFGEGTDIPNIETIVVCDGGKSPIRTLQRIGRGMRTNDGKKKKVDVWDFNDMTHRHLIKHSKARIKACQREGYPVTIL